MLFRPVLTALAAAAATAGAFAVDSGAATPSDQVRTVVGARSFAKLTAAAQAEFNRVAEASESAGQAAREAGAGCLTAWRAAPAARRSELFDLYFVSVGGGFFTIDGPVFARWVDALETSASIGRVPVLRGARRDLRSTLGLITRAVGLAADACATVRRWQAKGFRRGARPRAVVTLQQTFKELGAVGSLNLAEAAAVVERNGGFAGGRAAELVAQGIDEPDSRVLVPCDPVAEILDPNHRSAPVCRPS